MRLLNPLILILILSGCDDVARESALENTIALFESNGLRVTTELREEINRAALGTHTFDHLLEALTNLKTSGDAIRQACLDLPRTGLVQAKELQQEIDRLKNRTTALQIIAFHNNWPVENRFRWKKGEISCIPAGASST